MKILLKLTILSLVLLPLSAVAKQAFVTDKLVIDVYTLKGEQGKVVTSLFAGTAIDVTETDQDYSKIRTKDNKEGWIHSKYLTSEKPISLEHLQLIGKHKKQAAELKKANEKIDELSKQNTQPTTLDVSKKELDKKNKKISSLNKELKTLSKDIKNKSSQLDKAKNNIKKLEKTATKNQAEINKLKAQLKQAENVDISALKPTTISIEKAPPTEVTSMEVDQGPFKVPFIWTAIAMVFALVIGIIIGVTWLDRRIRSRHGGVRIY